MATPLRTRNEDDMRRNETPEQREIRIKRFEKVGKAHRWKKGQSGNPSGKGKAHFDVAKQSRKSGPEVVRFWKEVMQDPKMPIGQRMRASENLMSRGFGRPPEPLHLRVETQINHREAHLDALRLVNEENRLEKLKLTRRDGKTIEGDCIPDVSTDNPEDQENDVISTDIM